MNVKTDWLFVEQEDINGMSEETIGRFQKEHEEALAKCLKEETCPCGQKLSKDDTLYDRGWNCGIECEYCK